MKIEQITTVFDALGQESRLRIFRIMVENSKSGITPTEIAQKMGNMPRNTLSFHLGLLTGAGLCKTKKNGKSIVYTPECKTIKKIAEFLLKDCCDGGCTC